MPRLLHVFMASWTAGAALMMSVSAWYLLKKRHLDLAKANMKVALAGFILFATANFGLMGPSMAIEVTHEQPLKLASMEGLWESTSCAPLYLVGWVDEATQTTTGISIPCLLSVLAYFNPQATVQGINSMSPPDPTPPINLVFQVYHFMFGFGSLFVPIGLLAGLLYWRKQRLFTARWMLWILVVTVFFVEAAIIAGWWTAEVGRQPWVVYNVLKTADGVSPTLSRDRRRRLARHVHRPVRDPARAVPVPAQPGDPARARSRSRTSRRSTGPPCPTRSARSSRAGIAPARAESD